MPNIESIIETMQKQRIPEETIEKFILPKAKNAKPVEIVDFINQMDKLLSKEQRLSVMGEQGCYKTDVISAKFREFGNKHADKSIKEKIELLDELDTKFKVPCKLNPDGTISIYWQGQCHCKMVKKLNLSKIPLILWMLRWACTFYLSVCSWG
jgi:hypothetical protein